MLYSSGGGGEEKKIEPARQELIERHQLAVLIILQAYRLRPNKAQPKRGLLLAGRTRVTWPLS